MIIIDSLNGAPATQNYDEMIVAIKFVCQEQAEVVKCSKARLGRVELVELVWAKMGKRKHKRLQRIS